MSLNIQFAFPPSIWDELINAAGNEAGFCQSSTWGRILSRLENAQPIYIYNDNFGLQLFRRIPFNRESQARDWKSYFNGTSNGCLDWADGPFFLSDNDKINQNNLSEALNWVEEFARINKLTSISSNGFSQSGTYDKNQSFSRIFAQYGYNQTLWGTYLVDLSVDTETLKKSFEASGRKSINKAIREGLTVVELKNWESYQKRFLIPYQKAESAFNRKAQPKITSQITWEEDKDKNYRYFISIDPQGETLGMLGMICFNQTATEITSAISKRASTERLPSQDILHWEMFLAAKESGCTKFNLAGVNPNPKTPKEHGIRQFKAKWGGEYLSYFRYSKHFPNTVQKLYHLIQPIRTNK